MANRIQSKRRSRGILLTATGSQKLRKAIESAEDEENFGQKFTGEELNGRVGLDLVTINKIRYCKGKCDLSSVERFFSSFNIDLHKRDYYRPIIEDKLHSIDSNDDIHEARQTIEKRQISDKTHTELSCILTNPEIFFREDWYNTYMPQTISSHEHSLNLTQPVVINDIFQFNTSLVITGESGTGKSVFLKSCFIKASDECYQAAYVDLGMEYARYDAKSLSKLILGSLTEMTYIFIDSVDEYFSGSLREGKQFIANIIYQNSRLTKPSTIIVAFRNETLFPTSTSYLAFSVDPIDRKSILTRLHSVKMLNKLHELSNENYVSIFERPIFLNLIEKFPILSTAVTSCSSVIYQVINEEFSKAQIEVPDVDLHNKGDSNIKVAIHLWNVLTLIVENLTSNYFLPFTVVEDICSAHEVSNLFEHFLNNSCFFKRTQFGFRLSNSLLVDFIRARKCSNLNVVSGLGESSTDELLFIAGLSHSQKIFSMVLDEARTRSISLALSCIRDSPISLDHLTVSVIGDAIETYIKERNYSAKINTATATQIGIRPLGMKAGKALLSLSKDSKAIIRAIAIYILGEVGLTEPEVLNQVLKVALNDDNFHVQYHALEYLWLAKDKFIEKNELKAFQSKDLIILGYTYALLNDKPNPDYEFQIINMLASDDLDIAHHAADYLYHFGTREAISPLLKRIEDDTRWMVRARCMRALINLPFLPTRQFIISATKDSDCDVRYFAIRLLTSSILSSAPLLTSYELKKLAELESEAPNKAELLKLIAKIEHNIVKQN
ncbi:MAG: HEAT repeat domain-containing protein [Cyanothece sp. SIO1E1]|nr:HEAT repeat domain-containing protein [Cyanothece sp. SIO1E1]